MPVELDLGLPVGSEVNERRRIGMITPSANTCLEPVTYSMVTQVPDVSVHFTRLAVRRVGLDSKSGRQFSIGRFLRAARLLADAEVDVIVWNGTAGSWMGLEFDDELCRRIESATGIPATTSSLAMVDCLKSLGVERYSLVAPFPRDIIDTIVSTYAKQGLSCVRSANLPLLTTLEKDRVPMARIQAMLREARDPESQAIAVVCTNFRVAPLVEAAERTSGAPILDSVAVTLWGCFRMMAIEPRLQGWGALMAGSLQYDAAAEPNWLGSVSNLRVEGGQPDG